MLRLTDDRYVNGVAKGEGVVRAVYGGANYERLARSTVDGNRTFLPSNQAGSLFGHADCEVSFVS